MPKEMMMTILVCHYVAALPLLSPIMMAMMHLLLLLLLLLQVDNNDNNTMRMIIKEHLHMRTC
jgi:hypothetical protein